MNAFGPMLYTIRCQYQMNNIAVCVKYASTKIPLGCGADDSLMQALVCETVKCKPVFNAHCSKLIATYETSNALHFLLTLY